MFCDSCFLTVPEVAELHTTQAQVYALIRGSDMRAMKMGGRGQWPCHHKVSSFRTETTRVWAKDSSTVEVPAKLTSGETAGQDRFSQRISEFRRDVKRSVPTEKVRGSNPP
jgi:hypothetical protein